MRSFLSAAMLVLAIALVGCTHSQQTTTQSVRGAETAQPTGQYEIWELKVEGKDTDSFPPLEEPLIFTVTYANAASEPIRVFVAAENSEFASGQYIVPEYQMRKFRLVIPPNEKIAVLYTMDNYIEPLATTVISRDEIGYGYTTTYEKFFLSKRE